MPRAKEWLMTLKIDEDNLKHGLLGLVMALVEVIRDALKHQAFRRMESGRLTPDEIERLGRALASLDEVIEDIKRDQGIAEAVRAVRDGLDDVVDEVIDRIINPEQWASDRKE